MTEEKKVIENPIDRQEAIIEKGSHIVTQEIMGAAEAFFKAYKDDMTQEEMKERYAGMYGKLPEKAFAKRKLKRIWEEFLEKERRDFIVKHNTMSMEDIVRIGIDKFVLTLGWNSPKDTSKWRNNVVRVGICPECGDQFIPLIFQANQGLCANCRPNYSIKAIRKFIEYIIATNERYENAQNDALMDFYILFYNDAAFRHLFIKGTVTAKEYEELVVILPDWYKEHREKEDAHLQQKLIEMVPEDE